MKKKYFIIFIFIYLISNNLYAQSIAIVNIQYLIDNNKYYKITEKEIQTSRTTNLKKFEKKEIELQNLFNDIENSKLILNQNEINLKIENYNKKLDDFTILIEEFNFHYQNQIINIREAILKEIIALLEKYAVENNIDLILDSTTYLIASNSLDITNNINNKLEKLNLNLEYKDFEKY